MLFAVGWIGLFAFSAVTARPSQVMVGGIAPAFVLNAAVATAVWMAIFLRLPARRTSWIELLPGFVFFGWPGHDATGQPGPFASPLAHSAEVYGCLEAAGVILAWFPIVGPIIVRVVLINVIWPDDRADQRAPIRS